MGLLVQKYGGTSVGTIERIKHVAEKVRAAKQAGGDVVVVVSAMAGETNRLIALANQIAEIPDEREKDVLLASGEQVSVALLSLALKELGQPARSYLGHGPRFCAIPKPQCHATAARPRGTSRVCWRKIALPRVLKS